MTTGYAAAMTDQNKHQLPPHWAQGWAHCAFAPQAPILYGEGETILLAEKDPTLLKLGKSLLENLNYLALTANSGELLLKRCENERIDVIIFDVDFDHQEAETKTLLAEIRRLQPAMKVLLATAHDVSLGLSCCPPITDLPVLTKPFTVQSFSQAIRQCLSDQ